MLRWLARIISFETSNILETAWKRILLEADPDPCQSKRFTYLIAQLDRSTVNHPAVVATIHTNGEASVQVLDPTWRDYNCFCHGGSTPVWNSAPYHGVAYAVVTQPLVWLLLVPTGLWLILLSEYFERMDKQAERFWLTSSWSGARKTRQDSLCA